MSTTMTKPKLVLPTQRSGVDDRWTSQTFGMIGPAGIGKSEFWSFANGLHLDTENGLSHLSCMKVALTSWEDFLNVGSELFKLNASGKPFPYDTIIIDTIDELVELATQHVLEEVRRKFPNKEVNTLFDYPASSNAGNPSWTRRSDLIRTSLNKLSHLPCAVVFIGHLGTKETTSTMKETITIGGQLGAFLCHWPNHLLNITTKKEGQQKLRVVRTIPTDAIEAKSRDCKVPDGWKWENPKSTSLEDRMKASEVNFKKLRSLFT